MPGPSKLSLSFKFLTTLCIHLPSFLRILHVRLFRPPWFDHPHNTVKPVLNGPFIKRNFVLNGNIFRSRDYHSIPWLNGNLASEEKCSGPLRFRLRQVLLHLVRSISVRYPVSCCFHSLTSKYILQHFVLKHLVLRSFQRISSNPGACIFFSTVL
jgi:hypothetical protein